MHICLDAGFDEIGIFSVILRNSHYNDGYEFDISVINIENLTQDRVDCTGMTSYINLMYPDVLGTITDNRINIGSLQYAVGAFPRKAHLNQPLEIVVILQNMMLQNMRVKVAIRPPEMDRRGNLVVIEVGKRMISLGLRPGEVGVLRIPIMPLAPTKAGTDYPVPVAVRYRIADAGGRVARPPRGGIIPSVLSISPFKLQALKNITYEAFPWYQSNEIVTTHFDVVQKNMPRVGNPSAPIYETLWSSDEMQDEVEFVAKHEAEARKMLARFKVAELYRILLEIVSDLFKQRGMSLLAGEDEAITRVVFFVIDGVIRALDDSTIMADMRWVMTLCQLVAHHPEVNTMEPGELIRKYLLDALIFDACMVAYRLLDEHKCVGWEGVVQSEMHANRFLAWLAEQGTVETHHLYEPLVFGGILLSHHDFSGAADPRNTLDAIRKSSLVRLRLSDMVGATLPDTLAYLLSVAEQKLVLMKLQRP